MKRRDFLKRAATASGAAGISTLAAPAIAQTRRELTIVTDRSPSGGEETSLFTGEPTHRLFHWIERATNGELIFQVYESEDAIPEDGEFGLAMEGRADGYYAGEYHWNAHHILYRLFGGSMPMGLSMEEFMGWFYHRGGEEMWVELGERFNIKPVVADTVGTQVVGWFTEEVRSLEDFEGKSMHMPAVMGYIMERLGATVGDYETPVILSGLRDGTIYAVERSGPANDMRFGFHEYAKYLYISVLHEPHTFGALGFNLDIWNSFTPDQQRIIRETSMAHHSYAWAESTARNAAAMRTLQREHDVCIMQFPEEVMIRMCELSGEFVREMAATDDFSRRVVESYIAYRDEALDWSEQTVAKFVEARRLPFRYSA
ncbi:MAG: twin-arginine translocation signal domain-containing protein [Proteobacteria bacterium]|nr:twin-arginine translocation signal domain-containing protein [Pseudomonadota bacterium]